MIEISESEGGSHYSDSIEFDFSEQIASSSIQQNRPSEKIHSAKGQSSKVTTGVSVKGKGVISTKTPTPVSSKGTIGISSKSNTWNRKPLGNIFNYQTTDDPYAFEFDFKKTHIIEI
eukprot:GHVR01158520.1.p1 GENE.GHVR01158520.1~~GHVR01158520.1.p1  ORF type:complete len:117 (+),score=27.25 GHVR01158520.1:28-378(+)